MSSIGSGFLPLALRADYREQLSQVKKECGFKSLRAPAHLHDYLGLIKNNNGNITYNFQELDKIYDFFVDLGIYPIVGLNFPSVELATGHERMFDWQGNVTVPVTKEWEKLLNAYFSHYIDRYGKKELSNWYFDVWNEPQLKEFFTGSGEEYFDLYFKTATLITGYLPKAKVGGPNGGGDFVEDFIFYCKRANIPLDFISVHLFAVEADQLKDGSWLNRIILNPDHILKEVKKYRQWLDSAGKNDTSIIGSELNSSWCPMILIQLIWIWGDRLI